MGPVEETLFTSLKYCFSMSWLVGRLESREGTAAVAGALTADGDVTVAASVDDGIMDLVAAAGRVVSVEIWGTDFESVI